MIESTILGFIVLYLSISCLTAWYMGVYFTDKDIKDEIPLILLISTFWPLFWGIVGLGTVLTWIGYYD